MTASPQHQHDQSSQSAKPAFDYALRSATFALMRGEASFGLRIARQLSLAAPGSPAVAELLAKALQQHEAAARTVAAGDGTSGPERLNALAAAHLGLGDFAAAADIWLSLARAHSADLDAFLSFAWCMARLDNADNAAEIANRVAATARHPKINAVLMMAALSKGDDAAALKQARMALGFGADAVAWLPFGPAFEKEPASKKTLASARALENVSATLHLDALIRAVGAGRHGDAVAEADRVLADVPDDLWAATLKTLALVNLGDKVGAAHTQSDLMARLGLRHEVISRFVGMLQDVEAHEDVVSLGRLVQGRFADRHGLLIDLSHSAAAVGDLDFAAAIRAALPAPSQLNKAGINPFVALNIFDDAAVQKQIAVTYAEAIEKPAVPCPVALPKAGPADRIKVGYFSSDYHEHATMALLLDVLRQANHERFEIAVYSYDRTPADKVRDDLRACSDRFVDVTEASNDQLAEIVRGDGIHILVELKGFTTDNRVDALRHRLAPIQVSWLGYPGTSGLSEMDYVLADRFLVPPDQERHYTEKVVRMPDSYQPNGRRQVAAVPSRQSVGLPPEGFVFASFNQTTKINADVFAAWMDILKGVSGSLLWLSSKDARAEARLRARAAELDIDPARLVFAGSAPAPAHLARYELVDLALDTFPYGSHTTASDALWVGAPLLALSGKSFVSRVSGSILSAAGCADMISTSLSDYTKRAIAIGNDPAIATGLRAKLRQTRETMPLFDAARFSRHLERGYEMMFDYWRKGMRPRSFDIPVVPPRGR